MAVSLQILTNFAKLFMSKKNAFSKALPKSSSPMLLDAGVEGNEQATIQGFVEELNKTDNLKVLIKAIIKNQVFQTK